MISRVIDHGRRHSIGYLALGCSLLAMGGASYAAFRIPAHSVGQLQLKHGAVGERQLKNHQIDPVKWDQTYVTAFIRRYASVDAAGHLVTGSPFSQTATVGSQPGSYDVTWGDAFNGKCIAQATVQSTSTNAGFADTSIVQNPGNATVVNVTTYDTSGKPAAEPFSLAVMCPPGAGNGQRFQYTLP